MSFDDIGKVRLVGLEKELSSRIQGGDLPFLGLYSNFLYDKLEREIHSVLQGAYDSFELFLQSLEKWPAVFSTYLVQHVAEGYGLRGTHEVYPFISEALGCNDKSITSRQKEKLWSLFRRACRSVGVSVSPRLSGTNYMVEEYLLQAGVPHQYLENLIAQMIATAN